MNGATQWAEVRVGDLGHVFTGRTPSTAIPEYFGNDFFFITPGDMHQRKHVHATGRSLSNSGAKLLRRIQLPPKSICVSCIGWQMGEVVMTSAISFTNQQINSIVPNADVDADFIYYSFVPRKQELLSLASAIGVRTPILNKSGFCDLHVLLPPHPPQRKIAAILSAYDDLIETTCGASRFWRTWHKTSTASGSSSSASPATSIPASLIRLWGRFRRGGRLGV